LLRQRAFLAGNPNLLVLPFGAIAPIAARGVVDRVLDAVPRAVPEDLACAVDEWREPPLTARLRSQPREPLVGRVRIRERAFADEDVEALAERHQRAAGDLGSTFDDRLPLDPHDRGSCDQWL
jgi:hypothetical protein